jgi:hypothetical protein
LGVIECGHALPDRGNVPACRSQIADLTNLVGAQPVVPAADDRLGIGGIGPGRGDARLGDTKLRMLRVERRLSALGIDERVGGGGELATARACPRASSTRSNSSPTSSAIVSPLIRWKK